MKKLYFYVLILTVYLLTGCSYSAPEPIEVKISEKKVNYLSDVKPILDKRCVVCHSCYNSPCQAKFSSFDGVDRGGSKTKVYLAERLFAQDPTRLFVDAKNTQEWRKKKFFSLTQNSDQEDFNSSTQVNSIMAHMLYDKKKNPKVEGAYAPEYDDLICAKDLPELSRYIDEHPNHGMPYGFPELDEDEYEVIMQWLAQGANGPSKQEQKNLEKPLSKDERFISKWELFLNKTDAKHVMTARYIYEHYFIAHINFDKTKREFYTLVRSTTPPGEEIDVIATRRPYDKVDVEKFYYRFQKIHSTIVHKTHILVEFNDKELEKIDKLFIQTPWVEEPHVMSYEKKISANPFVLYKQIPTSSRYEYLLSHSEYIVRTFIRGPVCKGQIALNVVHDHFWLMFIDPKYDLGVQHPNFLDEQALNLAMPIEAGSSQTVFKVFSDDFRNRYASYYRAKEKMLVKYFSNGFDIDSIWKGKEASDTPIMTIYRHFDSASVHKGVIGELPRTMWVIDYAQLERIYYSLVAGFDVFGNVTHQTNIRRYMDFLRLEGELNFLFYMPQNSRKSLFESWYLGDSIVDDIHNNKREISEKIPSNIKFKTSNPKQEFIEMLVDKHFLKDTNIHFDSINYFKMNQKIPLLPKIYNNKEDIRIGLRALTAPGTGFIKHITNQGLNVASVKFIMKDGTNIHGTLVVNRWHDNVNSLFGEEDRLNPSKDTLDVVEGNIGSYPNVFIVVHEKDIPDFFDMVVNFEDNDKYMGKIQKYGISRSNKTFWKTYDWFQNSFNKEEFLESGLYDLNRYYKNPW